MEDQQRRKRLSHTLIASLLSVLATALSIAVAQSLSVISRPFTIAITVSFVAATLATLAVVYLDAYLRDLRATFRELTVVQRNSHVVPDIARFVSRQDIITLHANGDGEITWIFELASRPNEPVTELAFPLYYYKSPLAADDPSIRIESITVNEEDVPAESAFTHLEHRVLTSDQAREMHGGDESVDYGVLRVPVDFSAARPVCRIQVTIRFVNVFHDPVSRIYVDIPYVTEKIRVAITSPAATTRRAGAVGGHTVVARTAMQALDLIESRTQSVSCHQHGDAVVWESSTLKLGYQYVVHVRREDQPAGHGGPGQAVADSPSA